MAKIAIVSESMKMGGTEVAIISLIKKLIMHNHDVTLYLMGEHGVLLERVPSSVVIKKVELVNENYRLLVDTSYNISKYDIMKRVKRKIFRKLVNYNYLMSKCVLINEEYDLVCDAFGYGRFTTPFAALCLKGKKKALWFHDENLHWVDKSKAYFQYFDKLFCVSNSVKTQLIKREKMVEDKVEVLHNFIDPGEIIKKSKEKVKIEMGNHFNILTIARLEEQKGIDIAIDAAKILVEKKLKFNWYIIGDGSLKKDLLEKIEKCNLKDVFILLGVKKIHFLI